MLAQADRTPVTVLGMGPMGRALAGAFIDSGHPTTVWNRSAARAQPVVAKGAAPAPSAAEAAQASPLVVVCVLDDRAALAVLDSAGDALKGRTVVNLTTDSPERAREVAAWAEQRGVDYLDGSIMTPTTTIGGPAAQVLYSGPQEVYARHRAALADIGGAAVYLGTDPGRAAAFDVALLDLFWSTMSGYVHALALARSEGIPPSTLVPFARGIVDILPEIMAELARQAEAGEYPGEDSSLVSAAAGIEHIVHAAKARGLDTGVLSAAKDLADRAIAAEHGEDSFARLVETVAQGPAA
ncbi:3-hydroxyisobutyrate dehydrogenase-like beta-hydroxyacid dehydrogenase [Spinactinospora alkalitolerans]|uniref:3-hydroxyisobutyrate dehydrogenase-like beta-hydroxyacid dehydrogenase n=1 Tax=Spinactinospora alkalitolerans TaxID=687207 RepID=A0A852TW88_9ACTN|nr:NAD(P)-binding domain-containing protein [Spinactinospora alkalitolerans]NYE47655.1 3-hydroxyisobutyrate dehydrogenase-like beta-hydroxyacid dehydrogenase [Spinactinospora alkalitolerans]